MRVRTFHTFTYLIINQHLICECWRVPLHIVESEWRKTGFFYRAPLLQTGLEQILGTFDWWMIHVGRRTKKISERKRQEHEGNQKKKSSLVLPLLLLSVKRMGYALSFPPIHIVGETFLSVSSLSCEKNDSWPFTQGSFCHGKCDLMVLFIVCLYYMAGAVSNKKSRRNLKKLRFLQFQAWRQRQIMPRWKP